MRFRPSHFGALRPKHWRFSHRLKAPMEERDVLSAGHRFASPQPRRGFLHDPAQPDLDPSTAVWVSDTAQYGFTTWSHHLLVHDPSRWIQAALSIGPKPPIVPWIGEFLVPIGELVGNIDVGLLLLPPFTGRGADIRVRSVVRVQPSRLIAITGVRRCGLGAALHRCLKQPRTAGAARSRVSGSFTSWPAPKRWDALVIALQLSAATSFAMLTTMSSPAFA
jgi:hypothetical protein